MKSKTVAFATLLLVTAFLLMQVIVPQTALAADSIWTSIGGELSGYNVSAFACDLTHNILYAGFADSSEGHGVWKYDGKSWTKAGGLNPSYNVSALAWDPKHNMLYAACYDYEGFYSKGVWKYDGNTWTSTGGAVSDCLTDELCYDPNGNVLYAIIQSNGVWKYDGTKWTSTGKVFSDCYVNAIAYDSGRNQLYAGCHDNVLRKGKGVWKYDGKKWTDTGGEVSNYYIEILACDSAHNLLYAVCNDISAEKSKGVWKYDGKKWTDISGGIPGYEISSLACDSTHNLLYAGCYYMNEEQNLIGKGVWKYDGNTWTSTGGAVSDFLTDELCYDPNGNVLYAWCEHGDVVAESLGIWQYGSYNPNVPPADKWKSTSYFAEGYTGTNFQEYATLENPNSAPAATWITCLFPDGTSQSQYYPLAPASRLTVDINQLAGAGREVSMRVVSTSAGIVAERPMYFNYNGVWTGGSDAIGVTAPNTNWYFAEGNTLPNFDEYVTVFNPGDAPANLTFKYMVEGSGEQDASGSVGAHSRATFNTRSQIGDGRNASLLLSSDQAVVAERPMYFNYQGLASNNWTGGHDVVGANSPQKQWYLAEGTTRGGFEEWLCLQNPGDSDITVNARYLLGQGQGDPVSKSYIVPAKQRYTVSVNGEIGPDKDDSVQLTSTGSFIAERPMYFNYQGAWTGGHDVLGANSSAKTWFFAEGTTRDNFNEWLCLQNPGSKDAHATITYYTASGQAINKSWTVSANSRLTVNVNQDAGANQDISAKVSSDNPIVVERPMYFNYDGVWTGGHDVVGF